MLYYAKARNSASPDSRTQAGISQSPVLLWHQDSLVLSVPYAKAWNSASPDSRTQAGIYQSPVRLLHRDSLVLFNTLSQSLEFSFTGFQATSRYLPKPCVALAPEQPCRICCLVPKPGIQLRRIPGHKPVFTKALCCFGIRTALSYLLPYAKARNSALTDSRTQAGIYQSSVLLWHQDSLVLSVPYAKAWNSALTDSRTQTGISQSPVTLWHRDSLVVYVVLCQSLEFSFAEFRN